MPLHRFTFLLRPTIFCLLVGFCLSIDMIMTPMERFNYGLDQFMPTVKQELEFAELPGLTDDQVYEQLTTFYPILHSRITDLRNIGLLADKFRFEKAEYKNTLCGKGQTFYYLKLIQKMHKCLEILHERKITVAQNLAFYKDIYKGIGEWRLHTQYPCQVKG